MVKIFLAKIKLCYIIALGSDLKHSCGSNNVVGFSQVTNFGRLLVGLLSSCKHVLK